MPTWLAEVSLQSDAIVFSPVGVVTFNDETERYLCAAVLRPGNVMASACAV